MIIKSLTISMGSSQHIVECQTVHIIQRSREQLITFLGWLWAACIKIKVGIQAFVLVLWVEMWTAPAENKTSLMKADKQECFAVNST